MALYQAHWFGREWSSTAEEYLVTTAVGATAVAASLVFRSCPGAAGKAGRILVRRLP
jgi:hypothetical protein